MHSIYKGEPKHGKGQAQCGGGVHTSSTSWIWTSLKWYPLYSLWSEGSQLAISIDNLCYQLATWKWHRVLTSPCSSSPTSSSTSCLLALSYTERCQGDRVTTTNASPIDTFTWDAPVCVCGIAERHSECYACTKTREETEEVTTSNSLTYHWYYFVSR